jgi:hypothetical protein
MAWKTLLILFLVSCQSTTRLITLCAIDEKAAIGNCATKDKKWTLHFPDEMQNFYAWSEGGMLDLAFKLSACEQDGKLPKDDDTWNELNPCVIGQTCDKSLNGYYATDPNGAKKLQQKLEWCRGR